MNVYTGRNVLISWGTMDTSHVDRVASSDQLEMWMNVHGKIMKT